MSDRLENKFTMVLQKNFDLFEKQTLKDLGLTTIEQVFGNQRSVGYSNPGYGFFRVFATLKTTIQTFMNHPIFIDKHESTPIPYQGSTIDVDCAISQLMEEIWKAEIQTTGSCEDVASLAGYIWLNFETSNDFKKFMAIIFVGKGVAQTTCDLKLWSVKTNFILRHPGEDSIHEHHLPNRVNRYGNGDEPISHVSIRISLTFPVNDYEFILAQFQHHNHTSPIV